MDKDLLIIVKDLHKEFISPHLKNNTIKSAFVNLFSPEKKNAKQRAIKGIDLEVHRGDFLGIVGRNGCGKSTLLKILAGIYQPTKGSVGIFGSLIPFIELGVGFNAELTGRENVFLNGAILGKSKEEVEKDYDAIVEFSELKEHMDKKLKNYSSGMIVRLAFACATKTEADILIVDEVLAVGDADFQKKCFAYFKQLKNSGKTVILVTHDMSAVKEFCTRAVLIENGVITCSGDVQDVADAYAELFNPFSHSEIQETRWGNYRIAIKGVNSCIDDKNKIIIDVQSVARESLKDDLILAYAIKGRDGYKIMGNKYPRKVSINRGQNLDFKFEIHNILNKGKYLVDISIFSVSTNTYLDCWIDCSQFCSQNAGTVGYPVASVDKAEVAII